MNANTNELYYVLSQTWSPALATKLQAHVRNFCYWVLHGLWLNDNSGQLHVPPNKFHYALDREFEALCNDEAVLKKLAFWQPYIKKTHEMLQGELGKAQKDYIRHIAVTHGTLALHYDEKLNGFGQASRNIIEEGNRYKDMTDYLRRGTELVKKYNVGQYVENFSLGAQYHKIDFHNDIALGFTKQPRVKYQLNENPNLIDEVHLCFDLNFNPIDCRIASDITGNFLYSNCCDNVDKAIAELDENHPERYPPC